MTQEEIDRGAPVVVISSLFAQANQLDVGSTLTYNVYDNEAMLAEGIHLNFLYGHSDDFLLGHQLTELEVIGILNSDKTFLYPDDIARTWTMTLLITETHNQIFVSR